MKGMPHIDSFNLIICGSIADQLRYVMGIKMKNKNLVKKFLTYSILLTMAIGFAGCSKKSDVTNLETKYLSPFYAVDMDNPEEVVGFCTNVFVGYVEEMTDTYYISNIPYTRYDVRVINNIKGELPLDTTVQVNKEGGISEDLSYYMLIENDFLPSEGEYYIFNVRERIEDGSYTASGVNTAVLINDIDMQSVEATITSDNLNDSNINSVMDDIVNELNDSSIYLEYVGAYNNQIAFDPNRY